MILVCLAAGFNPTAPASEYSVRNSSSAFADYYNFWEDADELITVAEISGEALDRSIGELGFSEAEDAVLLNESQQITLFADIPEDGDYNVILEYKSLNGIILKSTLNINIAGQQVFTQIFSIWKDESKDRVTDRFNNQTVPAQLTLERYITDFVKDSASIDKSPCVFSLKRGMNELKIIVNDQPVFLKSVRVVKSEPLADFAEYLSSDVPQVYPKDEIVIEGENFSAKSDSYIRSKSVLNSAAFPYSYKTKLFNALDDYSYKTAGQRVFYGFYVKNPGLYNIGVRYSQAVRQGIPVYQNIHIDGKIPYSELKSHPFYYTGDDYKNVTLQTGGQNLSVFLSEGYHTVSFEADGASLGEIYAQLKEILLKISDIGLDIKKIAGQSSGNLRDWDVEKYLPGVLDELQASADRLRKIYRSVCELESPRPAAALNIKMSAESLYNILKKPEKIPSRLYDLSEGPGSVTQLLADQLDTLTAAHFSIDRIYFYSADRLKLPNPEFGFFGRIINSAERFLHSMFFRETGEKDTANELKVWMNRSAQHVETLQRLADSRFTSSTGISVRLSVLPGEQKLLLSNATKTSPDVALSLGSNTPYDFAVRGAVADLTRFEDFAGFINGEYNRETLTPYIYKDKIFGITETQEFYVLMYRKDILQKLELDIPGTWSDVANIMPVLRRNSMNFYLQLSGYSGTKPLYSVAPFILQNGGGLYAPDGLTTAINSRRSLEGFETLTNLFRLYSLPVNVASFYNSFRYGRLPLGIGSFTDYVKIKNAAPEIADLWGIALPPGTPDDEGNIIRGTTAAAAACAVMESSPHKDESWEFLKWWLCAETQIEFANTLQTQYGPEYLWNSANLKAFDKLAFPEEDKKVIKAQWNEMIEIQRHPALYMVERELSNAWENTVINGTGVKLALDNAALTVNREFTRKLKEFGYIDSAGKKISDYKFYSVDEILGEKP